MKKRRKARHMRVGAILSSNNDTGLLLFLGYGLMVGNYKIGPEAVGNLADIGRASGEKNPKIILDSKQVVWGCECWWMPEGKTRNYLSEWCATGGKVIHVDIDDVRKNYEQTRENLLEADEYRDADLE